MDRIASAEKIRDCLRCRQALSQFLQIPDPWWSDTHKRSNGYFGYDTTRNARQMTGVSTFINKSPLAEEKLIRIDTFAYFEVKQLPHDLDYYWDKINIFTKWIASTKQTIVALFDPNPSIRELILQSLLKFNHTLLSDPYWVYPTILDTLGNLQESAVWLIRNQVRDIEKKVPTPGAVPNPEYRKLHDIGRHVIHVSETLDVAVLTIESIQMHHLRFLVSNPDVTDPAAGRSVSVDLGYHRDFLANLRHRAASNEKRLQNEIQLAFNSVAQYNAGQTDSRAMKTIAFATLIFLGFISSLFSMSLFHGGQNNEWGVSSKFWLNWVFAIPITIATGVVWRYWHNVFPGAEYKPAPVRAGELPVRSESVMPKSTV
ncbi:hypothetical protein N7541_003384 [Penicillium brevicompactum]|uniref:Mg2+ transporter protein, CorA-like/Zinc transport protein ZntB n=1 Tax=Penicillium brevicompactum TaxID=5074 RepID=A0A9W9RLR5_PENBR|nr:hypothetical protein N7541_003384 [Penicillium brevicompactum]